MSPDEFRELLLAKGVSAACPVCEAEDWRGLDDVIDLPVRMSGATASENHVRIPGFGAIAPSCGRCGHVRLIDLRWLEAPAGQLSEAEPHRRPAPDVKPPADVEPTEPGQGRRRRSRLRSEPLTNMWGEPIPRPGDSQR